MQVLKVEYHLRDDYYCIKCGKYNCNLVGETGICVDCWAKHGDNGGYLC